MLPAADSLEQNLIAIIKSICEEGNADTYLKKLNLYKVMGCLQQVVYSFYDVTSFSTLQLMYGNFWLKYSNISTVGKSIAL